LDFILEIIVLELIDLLPFISIEVTSLAGVSWLAAPEDDSKEVCSWADNGRHKVATIAINARNPNILRSIKLSL